MGYRLARVCTFANDPPLSPNARLVLIRMAWATLDKPQGDKPSGEYWAGWEYLGMSWDDGTRKPSAVKQVVMRALAELIAKGYVKPVGQAHLGQRQHYQISVDN